MSEPSVTPPNPDRFRRDMACTESEWLRWLAAALAGHRWRRDGDRAIVTVGAGTLCLAWTVAPPRVIALMRLPRLLVDFAFDGVAPAEREAFLRRFDLHLQRGGG